jgi:DMSO/TMAO reductase YedYZ molybdopterin-dependent catalytic subunit
MSDEKIVSPGFVGRRRTAGAGLPPGQYLTADFPVLSAGPTPHVQREAWEFALTTESGEVRKWSWKEFSSLPAVPITTDIHCVTRWSKLNTMWEGVSVDTLLEGVQTSADFAMAHSYGGYTANLPLADLRDGKAWIAFRYDGAELAPEHGGPARLLVPHLYLWKSAKWVNGITLMLKDTPGFWESLGYNNYGDPWRRGLSLSRSHALATRPVGDPRTAGRVVRLAPRLAGAGAARCRRLGHRAADGDDPHAGANASSRAF